MLRVLTLSTLYPSAVRPNFGVFVERQTIGLAARPEVEVQVVSPRGLPPWPLSRHPNYRALADLPPVEQRHGVVVHRPTFLNLPASGGRFHARAMVHALMPFLRDLRSRFAFDVIDAEFFFPDGPAAVALGRALHVPVSIKARGADIHFWGTSAATRAQVREAGHDADGMLAVSGALRNDMIGLGFPAERIAVHRTGIDRALFRPGRRAEAKAALGIVGPLVVSVGALIPRKGHDIVIDAVAALPDVHLRIAGAGPEEAALAKKIATLGLGERVTLLGPLPHRDLPDLFAAADVMALASASEGLANVWVEALASGTPIVVPAIGGADEAVDRPSAGRMVARDANAFAGAIAELLTDPPLPGDTAAAAERFSWNTNAEELDAHLRALIGARRTAQLVG